jgi:drug/metabolite transporter (DMT)-like permease
MTAVTFVLASAFLHALWNALLKNEPEKDTAGVAIVGIAGVLAALVAAGIWIGNGEAPFSGADGIFWSVTAGVFEGIYFILLVLALSRGPLALVYTVSRGTAILAVWPLSIFFFAEAMSMTAGIGSAVVIVGLVATSYRRGQRPEGLGLAYVGGIAIAAYHLSYKVALGTGSEPAAVFALSLFVAVPINLLRLGRLRSLELVRQLKMRPLALLGMGVVCSSSFLLFLVALESSAPAFVVTLRNTSVVFATLLARAFGAELRRGEIIGCVLVCFGAALVAGWS